MKITDIDNKSLLKVVRQLDGSFPYTPAEKRTLRIGVGFTVLAPFVFVAFVYVGVFRFPPAGLIDVLLLSLIPLSIWVAFMVLRAKQTTVQFANGEYSLVDNSGKKLSSVHVDQITEIKFYDRRSTITLITPHNEFVLPVNEKLKSEIVRIAGEI